jgi:hypothetical protein
MFATFPIRSTGDSGSCVATHEFCCTRTVRSKHRQRATTHVTETDFGARDLVSLRRADPEDGDGVHSRGRGGAGGESGRRVQYGPGQLVPHVPPQAGEPRGDDRRGFRKRQTLRHRPLSEYICLAGCVLIAAVVVLPDVRSAAVRAAAATTTQPHQPRPRTVVRASTSKPLGNSDAGAVRRTNLVADRK